MSDDLERRLGRVTPRGASPELRLRVLAAVADELAAVAPRSRRPRRPALATAAAVVAALALNLLVNHALDRRLARVLGPPPVLQQAAEIAADVAMVTDRSTGEWAYARLASGQRPRGEDARRYVVRLQQTIRQLTVDLEGLADETPGNRPQMDRDRRGERPRHPADRHRQLQLEYRDTA